MSVSGMDEFFGADPNRPNHPDFWRMSEIVMSFDGRMRDAKTEAEKEIVWNETLDAVVDQSSLAYMAIQRAQHVAGVKQRSDMLLPGRQTLVAQLATVYMEGFLAGATFEQRGGKQ